MVVRAYYVTYGLPVSITRCSNNYGPYQFPEKLIPLMIHNALTDKPLPIYGDGMQIRDWLYVEDHCAAINTVLERGVQGEVYNIGGNNEKANIETSYYYSIAPLSDADLIVTDHEADPLLQQRYANAGIKVVAAAQP